MPTKRTQRLLDLVADEATKSRVLALLSSDCAWFGPPTTEVVERVQFAVIKLAMEGHEGLKLAEALYRIDTRDLVLNAGFGWDLDAHDQWYESELRACDEYASFEATRAKIVALNEKLQPIANRPVDTSDPNWVEAMRSEPDALDEADVRVEAEALLESILDTYSAGDARVRASIRKLIAENTAFSWATGVPTPPTTAQGFRQHLLRLSVIDQTHDLRDTILTITELCATATAAGIDTAPILSEVAALSSDIAETHMGSLKNMLERCSGQSRGTVGHHQR